MYLPAIDRSPHLPPAARLAEPPVAGRTVALRWAVCDNGPCATGSEMPFATTDQNGGFSFARNEPATRNYDRDTNVQYGAAFSGDAQYAGSSSGMVRKLC